MNVALAISPVMAVLVFLALKALTLVMDILNVLFVLMVLCGMRKNYCASRIMVLLNNFPFPPSPSNFFF